MNEDYVYTLLKSANAIIDENRMWLLSNIACGLIEISLDTYEIIDFYPIPDEHIHEYKYFAFTILNKIIYICPHDGDILYTFDIDNKQYDFYRIPLNKDDLCKKGKFRVIAACKDKVALIGYELPEIYYFSVEDKKFRRETRYNQLICQLKMDDNSKLVNWGYCRESDKLIATCFKKTVIFLIDLVTESVDYKRINCNSDGFRSISKNSEGYVLTDDEGKILFLDNQFNVNKVIDLKDDFGINVLEKVHRYIYGKEGNLILFPWADGHIISNYEKEIRVMFDYNDDSSFKNLNYSRWEFFVENGNDILFQERTTGYIYRIDKASRRIEKLLLKVNDGLISKMNERVLNSSGELMESKGININQLIELIKR